ncbi:MAG: hypothetical protein H6706_08850 [Myxococcales bacterium]|nr:hypothetical protein [Myxococcales bacterium]
MSKRRLPEDSVIVSIGDVHEMLAEEMGRQHEDTQPRFPVPLAVPTEVVGGVPSLDEIGASREARWERQHQQVALVRTVPLWTIWRRRLILLGAAAVVAAGTWGAAWWLQAPLGAEAHMTAAAQGHLAVAEAEARTRAAEAAQAEALARAALLEAEAARLAEAVKAAEARASQAAVIADTVAVAAAQVQAGQAAAESKPRVRKRRVARAAPVARRTTRVARKPRQPRKPRKPMNKTDQNLDSLLKGL